MTIALGWHDQMAIQAFVRGDAYENYLTMKELRQKQFKEVLSHYVMWLS